MSEIRTDRRVIVAEKAPHLRERLVAGREGYLDAKLALARVFAEVDRKKAFVFESVTSIGAYAADLGYDPEEATQLSWLGHALEKYPSLEADLRERRVTLSRAALVARILSRPDLVKPGEDWVTKARVRTMRDLRRDVRTRLEEGRVRAGPGGLVEVNLIVAQATKTAFERARVIASEEAAKDLSESQTFHRVTNFYLQEKDPRCRGTPARRTGPTSNDPRNRNVPAQVEHALHLRSRGMCEVGECGHVATEMAHFSPHEDGSGRELEDLWHACHGHHVLYDAMLLRLEGWSADRRPIFRNLRGHVFLPGPQDDLPPAEPATKPATKPATIAAKRPATNGTAHGDRPAGRPASDPTAGGASVVSECAAFYAGRRFDFEVPVVDCGPRGWGPDPPGG